MKISTRARGMSAFLVAISLVLTSVALFTCHWVNITVKLLGTTVADTSFGLFKQDGCSFFLLDTPSWNTATFYMMIISFSAQIVLILFILATSFLPRTEPCQLMKADLFLIIVSLVMLLASLITYGISSDNYFNFAVNPASLGYSFWLCLPATVFLLLAKGPIAHALHAIHRGGGDCDWRI